MRKLSYGVTGFILTAALFSSCTCNREIAAPAPVQEAPKSGFPLSRKDLKPERHAQVPTPPAAGTLAPEPEKVAEATPPALDARIPPDFPPDVPIFKDAAVSHVQPLANNAHNVIFRTSAPVQDVATFYQDSMTKGRWKVTQQISRDKHAFMTFRKGDMLANVQVAEDERNPGQQVIAIMYEQQKADEDDF